MASKWHTCCNKYKGDTKDLEKVREIMDCIVYPDDDDDDEEEGESSMVKEPKIPGGQVADPKVTLEKIAKDCVHDVGVKPLENVAKNYVHDLDIDWHALQSAAPKLDLWQVL